MHPRTSPSVFKYLDLADRFVRVRVTEPSEAGIEMRPDLDRAGYRRAVIAACVEGYEDDTAARIAALQPEDAELAEDVLYQLVVTVNPKLDIRSVALRSEGDATRPAGELGELMVAPAADAGALLRHLRAKAGGLAERLGARVFGQEEAVASAVQAVRRAASGLGPERGPLASLFFVGPTGTGKTELARELARELGGDGALLRIDCGELGLGHETSRLVGAPPGFVGFEEGGHLTEGMRRTPRSVVLFDEVEKAHPRLHDMLLSVLEEGELVDGRGHTVSFRETIVILTSNAGARDIDAAAERVGFAADGLAQAARSELACRALERTFAPEFLGRLDGVVHFQPLTPRVAREIARRQLAELARRVRASGRRLVWTDAVAGWLAEQGCDGQGGARGISAVLKREIEAPLADALLSLTEGAEGEPPWFRVAVRGGRPRVSREEA